MSEEFTNYVVEVGVDQTTGFFYRKWNDGICEVMGTFIKSGSYAANTRYSVGVNFPANLFTSVLSIQVNGGMDGQADTYVKYVRPSTTYADIYIQNGAAAASSVTYYIIAKGTWK